MAGTVTSRDAARINRTIRRSEGLAVNDPSRTLGPQVVGVRANEPNAQTVKVTSATPTAGLYPCEVAVRDAAGAAWELLGATVWAYDRNGAALVNGVYYDGEQVGNYTDGEPVFLVDVGTASAGGLISPPPTSTWNTDKNNYDPGTATELFINTTAAVNLTGIVAPTGGTSKIITIYNLPTSTHPIIVQNESGSSTNINRILTSGGLPHPIQPGEKIELIYDPTTNTRYILPVPPKVLFPASTTGYPSLVIPHGTAPTSPANGDVWTTSAGGLFVRINGVTKGPLVDASDVSGGGFPTYNVETTLLDQTYIAGDPYVLEATISTTKDNLWAVPWLCQADVHLDKLSINISAGGTASSLIRFGVWEADLANSVCPGSLLFDSGDLAADAAAFLESTANLDLAAGKLYWFALVTDAASAPNVYAMAGTSVHRRYASILGFQKGQWATAYLGSTNRATVGLKAAFTFGALPDPFPTSLVRLNAVADNLPAFGLKFS